MNIKELTLEQLKAAAYDQLVIIENAQRGLTIINQEIANRNTESKSSVN